MGYVRPAASQAQLLFDPATMSFRETVCRQLKVLETDAKTTPFFLAVASVPHTEQPNHHQLKTEPQNKCAVYQNKTGSERT